MSARVTTSGDLEVGSPGIGQPRLVGRDGEMDRLAAVLARPAVVLVEGEAGIGKTRLVQEFLATAAARQFQVLLAACPPFGQSLPLAPLVDALRVARAGVADLRLSPLAGALRPLFPEWAARLPPAPEPLGDAAAALHRVLSALAELVGRLGTGVLVVEDVHWADQATVEFLLLLACRRPRRVSLLMTCRPEDVPGSSILLRLSRLAAGADGCRLALGPLDTAGTADLVSSMLGGEPVSEEFAAFVHERTEGVPLAVEESVRLMGDRAELARRAGRWVRKDIGDLHVPPTVRDAVLERTGRLAADTRAVLLAAAVLAAPASEETLATVAGLPSERGRAGLCEALLGGLLAEETAPGRAGLVSFRHVLASRAVYESIPGPRRRQLHLRSGRALEDDVPQPLTRLARHFQAAGDTEKWRRYAERAADVALAAGDDVTASTVLHGLVTEATLPAREIARLTHKIMLQALREDAQLRDLTSALRAALAARHTSTAEVASLRFELGRVLGAMDEYPAARAELERAARDLPRGSLPAVRTMALLGWPEGTTGRVSDHLRWLRRAAEAAGALESSERLWLRVDRATALLMMGEREGWAEAAEIPDDAPEPQERLQVARGLVNVGDVARVWGRYAEARQKLTRAAELSGQYGYELLREAAASTLAHLDWFTGRWDGLAARTALLAADEGVQPIVRGESALVRGLLAAATGSREEAAERLWPVFEDARDRGSFWNAVEPAAALARLQLAAGDPGAALRITAEPAGVVAAKGIWLWAADLAPARVRALIATGRVDEAGGLVGAFARGLRGVQAPAPAAGLMTCRAILAAVRGQHAGAAALFADAAAAWRALPRPYDALLACEEQARCLLAGGQQDAALAMLSELRGELITLGALGDADRVVFTLREHGQRAKRPQRGGRQAHPGQLSPREVEVVRLVAQGQTDREVAASLYLSPKTVACHVESARRKLKVPSRAALVATAIGAGLTPGLSAPGA